MTGDALRHILVPGITGFDGAPDPAWTLPAFRAACHAAARTVGARVLDSEAPGQARNHYRARVALARGGDRWILLNAFVPLLAVAVPRADLRYAFVDEPELANAFHGPGPCAAVSALALAAALDLPSALPLLGPTEREQAQYWRPARLGDLIFNHWD